MRFFLRFFFIVLLFSLSWVSLSWAGFLGFIPADTIFLSGSNAEVHFDVASPLYGYSFSQATLNTSTRTFSWAFYLSGAGWVLFNTGTYMTRLDCGGQSLGSLSSNCTLSGYAWSETIGDIVFDRRLEYLRTTGTLSGKVMTNLGDVNLDGIMLPLLPASLSGSSYTGVADHRTPLEIANPSRYESNGSPWIMNYTPFMSFYSVSHVGSRSILADFSLAALYIFTITDPNGSRSVYAYQVDNTLPSLNLDSGFTTKSSFCTNTPTDTRCPDGATLQPTSLTTTRGGITNDTTVADGFSYLDQHLKLRDRYGNALTTGKIRLTYKTPNRLVQVPSPDTVHFWLSFSGDAVILSGGILTNNLNDTSTSGDIPMSWQNIEYGFSAYAPGTIELQSCQYNGVDTGLAASVLHFLPWYTLSEFHAGDIVLGTTTYFTGSVVTASTRNDVTPSLIHGLSIGNNVFATFASYQSLPWSQCSADETNMSSYSAGNNCSWNSMSGKNFPSIVSIPLGASNSLYSFTGTDTPLVPPAIIPSEPVTVASYITYTVAGYTVVYPSTTWLLPNSITTPPRVRIFWQYSNTAVYRWISLDPAQKSDFFNTVRKQIAYLVRNRRDFSNANFTYTGSTIHIDAASFIGKKSIIVEGANAIIDSNIPLQTGALALIVLTDPRSGSGGQITIASGVTDIHASLIAEHAVTSSGSYQLYIHGSLISSNTLGWASKMPRQCPYFDNLSCTSTEAQKYDLEFLRPDYPNVAPHTAFSLLAVQYAESPVVLDYDSRLMSDPPPWITQ